MVIKVRPNAPLEKRLTEITGAVFDARLCYYSRDANDGAEDVQYLVDLTGNLTRKKMMVVDIDVEGVLEVVEKPRINSRIYLSEISAKVAKEMKEEAENWDLQRGYFDGGCS